MSPEDFSQSFNTLEHTRKLGLYRGAPIERKNCATCCHKVPAGLPAYAEVFGRPEDPAVRHDAVAKAAVVFNPATL